MTRPSASLTSRGLDIRLSGPWTLSCLASLAGAFLAFIVIRPQAGIDDANITFVYARHIADGLGYVYNVGGEKVEGSTSLLWTGLTSLFFLFSDHPEPFIGFACFGMTTVTVRFGIGVAELFAQLLSVPVDQVRMASAASLLLFPSFFAWSVWTLMDLTVWVMALTVLFYLGLQLIFGGGQPAEVRARRVAFVLLAGILPTIRPEGIAVAAGLSLGLAAYLACRRRLAESFAGVAAAALAVTVLLGVTLWRMEYFGYPLPNTFYAKVSTGILDQAIAGSRYVILFLVTFPNVLLVAAAVGLAVFARSGAFRDAADRVRRDISTAPLLYLAGFCVMYAVLGGDHFAFHRFLQPVIPVLAPLASLVAVVIWRAVGDAGQPSRKRIAAVAGTGVIALAPFLDFADGTNSLTTEFRIADFGRLDGEILNTLPGQPSVGVLAAGGVATTYTGHIYDLLGLNWTEMAHAVDDLSGTTRNHGSFDRGLFFKVRPDLVAPVTQWTPCLPASEWPEKFHRDALKGLLHDPEFISLYAQACYRGMQLYVRRDLLPEYAGLMQKPQGERW